MDFKYKPGDIVELRGEFGPADGYAMVTDIDTKEGRVYCTTIIMDNKHFNVEVFRINSIFYRHSKVLDGTLWNLLYG